MNTREMILSDGTTQRRRVAEESDADRFGRERAMHAELTLALKAYHASIADLIAADSSLQKAIAEHQTAVDDVAVDDDELRLKSSLAARARNVHSGCEAGKQQAWKVLDDQTEAFHYLYRERFLVELDRFRQELASEIISAGRLNKNGMSHDAKCAVFTVVRFSEPFIEMSHLAPPDHSPRRRPPWEPKATPETSIQYATQLLSLFDRLIEFKAKL